jgi:signal transduction histidine kinase
VAASPSYPASSPVTLRFQSEALEAAFRAEHRHRMARFARWPLLLGGLLFTGYGFVDQAVVPEHAAVLWAVRAGVGVVVLALAALLFRPAGERHVEALFAAAAVVAGASLIGVSWYWAEAGRLSSHSGLIVLLIYVHVLSRMRFVTAAALGWALSVGYLAVLARHPASDVLDLAEQGAAVVSANVTAMVASYLLERYARQVFWQTRSLEERQAELGRQAEALRAANGELERTLGTLQRTQALLVEQEKLASLGRLTAGVAHEIKNPLNFVNNFAALVVEHAGVLRAALDPRRGALPAEVAEEVGETLDDLALNAGKIAEHGRRADGIVRAMLGHARSGAGAPEAVEVNRLVREAMGRAYGDHRTRRPGLDVAVEEALDPAAGAVVAVAADLRRALVNVIQNAFDAVAARAALAAGADGPPYAPAVRVETRRAGDRALVCVRDNGAGMDEATRARAFEPFFTTKAPGEGVGLGLSLAYDIVAHGHGGALRVESVPGEGCALTVDLPRLSAVEGPTP